MEYLERQEGPDGQYCELLTRVTYQRQRVIETLLAKAESPNDQLDAAFRGLLWKAEVIDSLTGERTDDTDQAAAEVIQPWRERAVILYTEWYGQAFPGPKESTRTGRRTGSSAKAAERSATDEPR